MYACDPPTASQPGIAVPAPRRSVLIWSVGGLLLAVLILLLALASERSRGPHVNIHLGKMGTPDMFLADAFGIQVDQDPTMRLRMS